LKLRLLELALIWLAFEAVRFMARPSSSSPVRATQYRRRGRPDRKAFGFSGAATCSEPGTNKSLEFPLATVRPGPRPQRRADFN